MSKERSIPKLCAIFLSLLLATAAAADAKEGQGKTIGDLRQVCSGHPQTENKVDAALCIGVFDGFIRGFNYANFLAETTLYRQIPPAWCFPPEVTIQQLVAEFMLWSDRNPGNWQEPYVAGLLGTFGETWPCKM